MRLGVIDIGSNTVHLLVVDAYPARFACRRG
jgi:exopolyphosphatase/pppGpp-phosphohydrolase